MKNLPPRQEIEVDLAATQRDVRRLTSIVNNLDSFITDSCGEDRSRLRVDLMRYRSLLATSIELEGRISEALAASVPHDGPDASDGHDWEGFEGGCKRAGCEKTCGVIKEAVEIVLNDLRAGRIAAIEVKQRVRSLLTAKACAGQVTDDVPDRDDVVTGWIEWMLRQ